MPDVIEVLPDRLFMLGGAEPVDDTISWLPPGTSGLQSLNCFLLRSGTSALLVDTGVAKHRNLVLAQLRDLIGEAPLEVFLTRAESDCLGNLAAIAEEFQVRAVHTGGNLNPFDSFDVGDHATRSSGYSVIARIKPGQPLSVSPDLQLTVEQPLLRVLATYWLYDAASGTLFTSDSFAYSTLSHEGEPRIVDAPDASAAPSQAEIKQRLLAKFAYLRGGRGINRIADDLARIFAIHEVNVVAPSHGQVFKGRETVKYQRDLLESLLNNLVRHGNNEER